MEPVILHNSIGFFRTEQCPLWKGSLVLVECQTAYGASYTVKKYSSRKIHRKTGYVEETDVVLLSLNRDHPPIPLIENGPYRICGWYIGSVPASCRVQELRYEAIDD